MSRVREKAAVEAEPPQYMMSYRGEAAYCILIVEFERPFVLRLSRASLKNFRTIYADDARLASLIYRLKLYFAAPTGHDDGARAGYAARRFIAMPTPLSGDVNTPAAIRLAGL